MTQVSTTKKDLKTILSSDGMKERLNEILGRNASTFATSIVQIANSNSMLKGAEPNSIIGAAMTAATLKLPLNNNLGQAYIVPFNEKQKDGSYLVKAQFILGYKGLKQLAVRSGMFKSINAKPVYEGQKFEDDSFLGYHFKWGEKTSDKVIGYASHFELTSGYSSTLFISADEMKAHGKKFSQTFKKGFGLWKDEFDKMALKTVSKLHLNSGEAPLSIEMQSAIEKDQASISLNDDGTEDIDYVDNFDEAEVVKVDHEQERIEKLIEAADTQEKLDFAKSKAGEAQLKLIKAKQIEINKAKKAV